MTDDKKSSKIVIGGHRPTPKDQLNKLLEEFNKATVPSLNEQLGSSANIMGSITNALREIEEFNQANTTPKQRLENLNNLFGEGDKDKNEVMQQYLDEVVAPGKGLKYSELESESKKAVDEKLARDIGGYSNELKQTIALQDELDKIKKSTEGFSLKNIATKIFTPKKKNQERGSGPSVR